MFIYQKYNMKVIIAFTNGRQLIANCEPSEQFYLFDQCSSMTLFVESFDGDAIKEIDYHTCSWGIRPDGKEDVTIDFLTAVISISIQK